MLKRVSIRQMLEYAKIRQTLRQVYVKRCRYERTQEYSVLSCTEMHQRTRRLQTPKMSKSTKCPFPQNTQKRDKTWNHACYCQYPLAVTGP